MKDNITFYRMSESGKIDERIESQIIKDGFSGNIKVFELGLDTEDSMSLIIEGTYESELCCVAVGYGMNRQHLAIRKKWYRHNPKLNND